jgi:hypothetical protein
MGGSAVEDVRGRMLAAAMNLIVMNRGEPTFERGESRSVICRCHVLFARHRQAYKGMACHEAGMTTSDHYPIKFIISAAPIAPEVGHPARGWRWIDSKKDELALLLTRELDDLSSPLVVEL